MSSYTYWENCAASNVEQNPRPRALSQREEDEVVVAYEAGMSQAKIGEVFDISQMTVGQILKRRGVQARGRGRPRALSRKGEDEVVAAYEAGMSQAEIGEVFGVDNTTVCQILKRRCVQTRVSRGRPLALSRKEEDEVVVAYEAGMSPSKIGEVFGVSRETVYSILKRRGIKMRGQPLALSRKEEDEVVAAYEAGMSQYQIGDVLGVHQTTVGQILKRRGVQTRVSRGRPRALSRKEEEEIVAAYEAGMSSSKIGEVFGVSRGTVRLALIRRGMKLRPRSGGRPRALSRKEEDEVVDAYEDGMSQAKIGEMFGVDQTTVSQILKRRGVKARSGQPRALSRKEEDEVVAAYEAGMSQAEIGEVFGVDHTTVCQILKRRGVPARSQRSLSDEQERELVEAYLRGSPVVVISEYFGVHIKTIYRILERHGIKHRQPPSLSQEQEDEAIKAYEAGMSQWDISRILGVSQATIAKTLKRRGVPARSQRSLSDEEERAMVDAYLGGSSGKILAEAFGVSQTTVKNILHRHGVKMRKAKNPAGGVSTALALAAVSFLVLGASMAVRARPR